MLIYLFVKECKVGIEAMMLTRKRNGNYIYSMKGICNSKKLLLFGNGSFFSCFGPLKFRNHNSDLHCNLCVLRIEVKDETETVPAMLREDGPR